MPLGARSSGWLIDYTNVAEAIYFKATAKIAADIVYWGITMTSMF